MSDVLRAYLQPAVVAVAERIEADLLALYDDFLSANSQIDLPSKSTTESLPHYESDVAGVEHATSPRILRAAVGRVIFLDFDGVLVPFSGPDKKMRPAKASPACVDLLNDLIFKSDAYVVVSSDWRRRNDSRSLRRCLVDWGLESGDRVLGSVPWIDGQQKETCIQLWLQTNAPKSFVCLDDEDLGGKFPQNLVQINPLLGIADDDALRALEILENGAK